MGSFKYYVIPDLMTWARPMSGLEQTPIEHYDTIAEATDRFGALREQQYNAEPAFNEDSGEPYTRLCLGIESTTTPSSIDILHVRQGVHYLVDDYRRIEGMKNNPEVLACLHDVSAAIGFDRVQPYVTRKDERGVERLVPGTDRHISEWYPFHEFGHDQHFIRFPSLGPGDLFKIRDGQSIIQKRMDGTENSARCEWIDDFHVRIGYRTWHIDEFAEVRFRNGFMVVPQYPQPGDNLDSFSIYQIPRGVRCDYKFASYEQAKGEISAADYECSYVGNSFQDISLDRIYDIFNRDDRPGRFSMHSLSMSDIVVLDRDGNEQAFYVDTVGFEEIPGFSEKLHEQMQLTARQQEATLDER